MITLDGVFLEGPGGAPGLAVPDGCLEAGATWVIAGPSGSGKSQILRCLAGVSEPPWGRVVRKPGLRTGFVFGRGGLLANHTLLANAMLPLRFQGIPVPEARVRAEVALAQVRLAAVADHRPHVLSDRQRKLGALARVLAWDPDLVLLDEPLDTLDAHDLPLVRALIAAWAQEPTKALVVATEQAEDHAHLPGKRFTLDRNRMLELA